MTTHNMTSIINCNTCGGYQSGAINMSCTVPIKLCSCSNYYSNCRQGWICSRCNKSLSPDTKECDCSQEQGYYQFIPYVPWYPYTPVNPWQPFTPINPSYPFIPVYTYNPLQHWDMTITCSTYTINS